MRRLSTAGHNDTRTGFPNRVAAFSLDRNGRCQMHEKTDWRQNALTVVNQLDQFSDASLPAKIEGTMQFRMKVTRSPNLHEVHPAAVMIHDLLKPLGIPPLDREVSFPARSDDPVGA